MTNYSSIEKLIADYAHDYRDMTLGQGALCKILRHFVSDLDSEASKEKPDEQGAKQLEWVLEIVSWHMTIEEIRIVQHRIKWLRGEPYEGISRNAIPENHPQSHDTEASDVPEAARAAYTCKHEFTLFNPLDTKSIAVYCSKCGTTVDGAKIIPPVAYTKSEVPPKECEPWCNRGDVHTKCMKIEPMVPVEKCDHAWRVCGGTAGEFMVHQCVRCLETKRVPEPPTPQSKVEELMWEFPKHGPFADIQTSANTEAINRNIITLGKLLERFVNRQE